MAAMYKLIDIDTLDPFSLPSMPLAECKNLPEIAAIYFAIRETGEIPYIGESVNIRNRWRTHNKKKVLDGVSIAWLPLCDYQERVEAEGALILRFKPALNRQCNRAIDRRMKKLAWIAKCEAKIAVAASPVAAEYWVWQRDHALRYFSVIR